MNKLNTLIKHQTNLIMHQFDVTGELPSAEEVEVLYQLVKANDEKVDGLSADIGILVNHLLSMMEYELENEGTTPTVLNATVLRMLIYIMNKI